MKRILTLLVLTTLTACSDAGTGSNSGRILPTGKADDFAPGRQIEVLLTAPHCDVCQGQDKSFLLARSPIISKVIDLIEGAQESIEVAQFTFSRREIEAALLEAHQRGIDVRLAMNHAQAQGDNVSNRLKDAGLNVRFVEGNESGGRPGLMHAKFMLVDRKTLLMGSNNWSSTGTSINNENTMVIGSLPEDPLLMAFACDFEAIWEQDTAGAVECSTEEVLFTPGSAASKMIVDQIRGASESVDVLMHHLLFDKLTKTLAQAAERGIEVRVIVNAADRSEISGNNINRLLNAGGQIRYKQTNPDLYQIMHHKLAVIDKKILVNGSGNWSGSAFFNNFEFYLASQDNRMVDPFKRAFERLWAWSLTADSLDQGQTAALQDAALTDIFFGNLHAHHYHTVGSQMLDDGKLIREIDGERVSVEDQANGDAIRYAFEYARDQGDLDFLVLSPHVYDFKPSDQPNMPNMTPSGYTRMLDSAQAVTEESQGAFLAIASMEWSTNSSGNHVNIFGSRELCKSERGVFDQLYDEFLPLRVLMGDKPLLMFNHPRTFRLHQDTLQGTWDQVFDVDLRDVPNNSQRNKKFNDFGLDDYPPLKDVRQSWLEDGVPPDSQVVTDTLANIWKVTSPYLRLMEVTLNRGSEIAHTNHQNPSLVEDDLGQIVRRTKVHTDWDYYLLNGFRIAPVANHDNHYANWGTGHSSRTGLIAKELTEHNFMKAIDQRSVYASEDENLELRLYAEDRIRAGQQMLTLENQLTLNLHLSDPDYPGPFHVVVYLGTVGGETVPQVDVLQDLSGDQWHEIAVNLPGPGQHFIYVEVSEPTPNRMAWSAPIWVEKAETP